MLLKKRATSHEAAGKDDWKKKKVDSESEIASEHEE